jgi:hypothetical protein
MLLHYNDENTMETTNSQIIYQQNDNLILREHIFDNKIRCL